MSRDRRAASDLIARAMRRGRIVAVVEAIAWGAAVASMFSIAGIVVAALVLAWRARATARPVVVRAIDRTTSGARNLIVTADELERGELIAKPSVRDRVLADADRVSTHADLRRVFPLRPVVRASIVALGVWVLVSTAPLWRGPVARIAGGTLPLAPLAKPVNTIHLTATIEPPLYTHLPRRTVTDATEVSAVEGSVLALAITGPAARVTVDHDGTIRDLHPDNSGGFIDRVALTKTGYYGVATDTGARRVMSIVVSPDALPSVRVTTPGRDLVFPDPNQHIAFEARASDDFGLRSLALQYTKVAGSGETYQFEEGEIPLAVTHATDRDWRGGAARSLADLHLKDGDILVYRAVASDDRQGSGSASSDAFFIEVSKLATGAGDAFTVPQEETRYALSEQMLVVKTERLEQRRASMVPAEFQEAAANLSIEQRMIRAEFVFMLGGEIQDEEVEAEQSTELAEGRLQNRGQRDLRDATVAMSQAEKLLTAGNTDEALGAERRAIAALQRAFARDRYILRALAGQTDLDPTRRLTGSVPRGANWRRQPPLTPENRRTALLADVLAGLGELRTGSSSTRVAVLAGETLRVDPDSTTLRQASADLQRAADTWSIAPADAHRRAIAAAAAAIARELARTSGAAPPPPSFVAPSLAGAFSEKSATGGVR